MRQSCSSALYLNLSVIQNHKCRQDIEFVSILVLKWGSPPYKQIWRPAINDVMKLTDNPFLMECEKIDATHKHTVDYIARLPLISKILNSNEGLWKGKKYNCSIQRSILKAFLEGIYNTWPRMSGGCGVHHLSQQFGLTCRSNVGRGLSPPIYREKVKISPVITKRSWWDKRVQLEQ